MLLVVFNIVIESKTIFFLIQIVSVHADFRIDLSDVNAVVTIVFWRDSHNITVNK